MDKKGRENKRLKNFCVYSGRPIGSKDAVLIEEAPNFLRNSGFVVVDAKEFLRNLGYIVSNKKFIVFTFVMLLVGVLK
jgi:hypothetical protein